MDMMPVKVSVINVVGIFYLQVEFRRLVRSDLQVLLFVSLFSFTRKMAVKLSMKCGHDSIPERKDRDETESTVRR